MKLNLLSGLGMIAVLSVSCRKDPPPPPKMDPEEERRAIQLREEADRRTAALKEAAALREAELKKAIIEDADLPAADKPSEPARDTLPPPDP
jgi:hypothetical protein